ncbi:MAG: ATP-grasp domain-containing protein [Myxococcota bacterium]
MTRKADLYLLTSAALAGLSADDQLLLAGLRQRGLAVEPIVWEDPSIDWEQAPPTVIRSTWDYAYRLPLFLECLTKVERHTRLLNPLSLVRWNAHKSYLLDLFAKGIEVIPTHLLRRGGGDQENVLANMVEQHDIVIKPAVGAGGKWTYKIARGDLQNAWKCANKVLCYEDALVQPFVPAVMSRGEVSVIVIDGSASHAVRKKGAAEDFRVHSEYGGTVEPTGLTPILADYATRVLDALPGNPFYARIDLVESDEGRPLLMEAELIEPELFFSSSPSGTALFIERLQCRLVP